VRRTPACTFVTEILQKPGRHESFGVITGAPFARLCGRVIDFMLNATTKPHHEGRTMSVACPRDRLHIRGAVLLLTVCATLSFQRAARAWKHVMIPWFFNVNSSLTSATIAVGDTVTWTWGDALIHSVRNEAGEFNSGLVSGPGFNYTHIFQNPGTFPYKCDAHSTMTGTIYVQAPGVKFVGRVLLEGPYAGGGTMSPSIGPAMPLSQPYADAAFDGTPLDYDGAETVGGLPAGTIDWLLVDLRTDESAAGTVENALQPAFLLSSGDIVGLDGDTLMFDDVERIPYHVVVRHRNHLSVMSADLVAFATGVGEWDFTTAMNKAYSGGGNPQKMVDSGVFAMIAADANADGIVTAPDFNAWNGATSAGLTGYRPSDFSLDTLVTAPDFNLWNANTTTGAASQVPE